MSRRKWWFVASTTVLALIAGVPIEWELYERAVARRELAEASAAVDAREPRWRLADLEADRQPVPQERNSAMVTREAFALLPSKWDGSVADEVEKVPPPFELPLALRERIAAELHANAAALPGPRRFVGSGRRRGIDGNQPTDLPVCRYANGRSCERDWPCFR